MTPEEFKSALDALKWSQADFYRQVEVDKSTASSWATGKTPIPRWVPLYLGSVQDIADLHTRYAVPPSRAEQHVEDVSGIDTNATSVDDLDATVRQINAKRRPGRPRKSAK